MLGASKGEMKVRDTLCLLIIKPLIHSRIGECGMVKNKKGERKNKLQERGGERA